MQKPEIFKPTSPSLWLAIAVIAIIDVIAHSRTV